jgi:DNA processing protein
MLSLHAAVALALLPGRARTIISARLREYSPPTLEPGEAGGPSLDTLIATIAPDVADPVAMARGLEGPARRAIDDAQRIGADALRLGEPRYPPLLASIYDPPLVLWVRGAVDALHAPSVAIVGARAATPGGCETARWLAADLASAGITVVSGLARGVDAAAHAGALETGRTAAVLGTGVDRVYPSAHARLADQVSAAGALVTEFVPGTGPHAHHFPMRNRIISGLCAAVVVVEAADKSGSLITARCALDQGRDVMAVPGAVRSGRNRGAHALLRDGARLVESAADVLEELGWPAGAPRQRDAEPSAATDALLAAMPAGEAVHLEHLAAALQAPPASLLARLSELEVAGRIARVPGGRFVRVER